MVVAAVAVASPAIAMSQPSHLAKLIADWRAAEVYAKALSDRADHVRREADLPAVCVEVGSYRCRYPHQVHGLFDRWIEGEGVGPQPRDLVERLANHRDSLVEELLRQEDALIAAELASGLTAAEEAADRAEWRAIELRNAIFSYRPGSLDDAATKNVFLLDWVRAGRELSSEDLMAIFGGPSSAPLTM